MAYRIPTTRETAEIVEKLYRIKGGIHDFEESEWQKDYHKQMNEQDLYRHEHLGFCECLRIVYGQDEALRLLALAEARVKGVIS